MTASSTATVPSFDLAGKRALITGGSRGIGLAAAEALAAFGAHVTLLARPSADLNAAIERLRADGRSADALELDVKDTAGLRTAIAARAPYDALVNNAGTNNPVTFLDVTEEQYDTIMTLNVRAAYFVAQVVAQKLAAAGRPGSIINVSSQMGHVGAATRTVYCASKWAMEGMTRAMAVDLAPHGIRVNTLCPTFIETPLARRMLANEQFRSDVLKKIKFKTASAEILPESNEILDAVATTITHHPEFTLIEVAGHADERASDAYNLRLTQDRVNSVMAALVARKVDKSKLRAKGYGEYCPEDPGHNEEAWETNRRVEFKIVKTKDGPTNVELGCEYASSKGVRPDPVP